MSTHSPITYLVRNRLSADILLPYPSCDPHPKEILWIGQCMLADERLLKALDGWLEIIDVVQDRKSEAGPAPGEVCSLGKGPEQPVDVCEFLHVCWELSQGRFVRVQWLADLVTKNSNLLQGVEPGSYRARARVGKAFRKWCVANPPGWQIQSRTRSHTVEYRISPQST